MALTDEEKNMLEQLQKNLDEILQNRVDDLVREEEFGRALHFGEARPYFERILRLLAELKACNLEFVSVKTLGQLSGTVSSAKHRFDKVKQFAIDQQNPVQPRNQLISEIREEYNKCFDVVAPIIVWSAIRRADFGQVEREVMASRERIEAALAVQREEASKTLTELQSVLEKARMAAQEVGVSQHAMHFQQQAEEHQVAARWWLSATSLMALLTAGAGGVSYYIYMQMIETLTSAQSLQIAIAKIVVFSVLFTATIWCGRSYRSNRHNYVVNKHRQNALSTFETFAKAASDDQTKSAVLLQTTNCIFSAQPTGFVKDESDGTSYPQILEIMRGFTGSPDKA